MEIKDYIKDILSTPNIFEYVNNLEINILEKLITTSNDSYFNDDSDTTVLPDEIYDILIDFLRNKDPKNKLLKKVGTEVKLKERVELPYSLFSMDKIKPPSKKLQNYINKFKPPFILSDKLDGVSGLLVYEFDTSISLYTRGTAYEGQNISKIIKYIKKIPSYQTMYDICTKHKIKGEKNLIAFRGELIMRKKTFDKNWSTKMKNSRNTVSGLVNSKNINPSLAMDTRFVVYEIVDPIMSLLDQYSMLKLINTFDIVKYTNVDDLSYDTLSEYLLKRKNKSKYLIDGIIVSNNEVNKRPTKSNPNYAFAFKTILEDQKAITRVKYIEWNKSKHGYIIPTIIIEPVDIGGVTIKRVTGNNAKNVVDNKIGENALVEIIRSGDVIPKIEKVIEPGKVNMPDTMWHWNDTKIDIIADDINTDDIRIKNLYNFFLVLGAKGLGLKVIEKLFNSGLGTIKKILLVKKDHLLTIDTIKERSADNIMKEIDKVKNNVSIVKLMVASNTLGIGFGIKKIKPIINKYPDLLTLYSDWSTDEFIENIISIDGLNIKSATLFVSNFNNFIEFYNDIKKHINIIHHFHKVKKGKYINKKIVLSGFRDKLLQEYLENEGAEITTSVSKNTNILIVKDISSNSSKIDKATELGIKILEKDSIIY